MIDIKSFKESIELGNPYHKLLIIVYSDTKFVAEQYAHQIAINNDSPIDNVESIEDVMSSLSNVFGNAQLKVLTVDKFQCDDILLTKVKGAIIITNKVEKETSKLFSDYILEIPKLENWQIEDYALTLAKGVREADVLSLVSACDFDLNRIDNELAKLTIFNEANRQFLFQQFTERGAFPTAEKFTIFSLSNALLSKNIDDVKSILNHIDEIDVNPLALLSIMYKNVANVISVQFDSRATAESLGMSSGQFYAIKKNNINYSSNQ